MQTSFGEVAPNMKILSLRVAIPNDSLHIRFSVPGTRIGLNLKLFSIS